MARRLGRACWDDEQAEWYYPDDEEWVSGRRVFLVRRLGLAGSAARRTSGTPPANETLLLPRQQVALSRRAGGPKLANSRWRTFSRFYRTPCPSSLHRPWRLPLFDEQSLASIFRSEIRERGGWLAAES